MCGALLEPDFSTERIGDYLTEVTEDYMGLSPRRDEIERATRALVALKKEFFGAN